MNTEIIDAILAIASQAFCSNESPDKFARLAAHEAAFSAAKRHSQACADNAALIAVSEFSSILVDAISFASRITDAANDRATMHQRYNAERHSFEDILIIPQRLTPRPYFTLVEQSQQIAHQTNALLTSSYLTIFSAAPEENHKAKHAARYVYRHTFSASRSAYVLSMYKARHHNLNQSALEVFQNSMKQRLYADLAYDQIKPSYLLYMARHSATLISAFTVIALSILMTLLGAFSVASLPMTLTICIGMGGFALGIGLLIGHYLAKNEIEKIERANAECEAINNIY